MKESVIQVDGKSICCYQWNTVVVGTGAAGYNAADRLYSFGQQDIAIVTEDVNAGTSRNTGSDKQTYYKLTLSGNDPDSVREMAATLFAGQCVDGDIALCEAALSAQGFLKLVELGVPFPRNRYGEYVGYKTDHDPRRRATSVGPYTSKIMTEKLQQAVAAKNIRVFDQMQAVRLLTAGGKVHGLLCLDKTAAGDNAGRFVAFQCKNIIYATGGPAGIYADSVYPFGHYGATGIAFEAGAAGKNLMEWQYGLASVKPRWNVSGTYMQVLPRFISQEPDGSDEREFLGDFFTEQGELLTKIFLKGYQWPFDVRKIDGGSSIIDILVYMENCKGRRVYLDFRTNPGNQPVDYSLLSEEANEYLTKAGACFGTPLERLLHMNRPAVEFYLDKGVDLAKEPLEIALCAQHNNGGLGIDCWWQTNVTGLFAVGEVGASHGVYRPGGSALNAGQVGSTRAAQYIAACCQGENAEAFADIAVPQLEQLIEMAQTVSNTDLENVQECWDQAARRMSRCGGPIRDIGQIHQAAEAVRQEIAEFKNTIRIKDHRHLWKVFRLWDILLCQLVYLEAMKDFVEHGGRSRGSALYRDKNGKKPYQKLPDIFCYSLDDGSNSDEVQEITLRGMDCSVKWRKVREIPGDDDFFENVWRDYRENGNIC